MKVNLKVIANLSTLARLGIFILVLLSAWLPLARIISLIFSKDPNLTSILTMGLVGIQFLVLLKLWSQYVDKIPNCFEYYGLEWSTRNALGLVNGLSIGLLFTLGLFLIESLLGWLEIKTVSFSLIKIIAEGLLSGLAVALFEELFFRGWLLTELERDYSKITALRINTLIFATLHFIRPINVIIKTSPQFFGLLILGALLIWAKRLSKGRLGLSIGLHAGLIWGYYLLNVGELLHYRGNVPNWVTGINNNPLAGLMGLFFLGILALTIRRKSLSILSIKST